MNKTEVLVELIYIWRKTKSVLKVIYLTITFPIWFVPFMTIITFGALQRDSDANWCERHHFTYPRWETHPHRKVNEYRRETRKVKRAKRKELRIARKELRIAGRQFEKNKIRKELKDKKR